MKRSLSILLVLVTCVTYILSTMGYGVHECAQSGSKDVILLFNETPCEYIHSHGDDSHSHDSGLCNCNHSEHDNNVTNHDSSCCHTSIYSISVDYTVSDKSNLVVSFANFIFIPTPIYGYSQQPLLAQFIELYWNIKQNETLCKDNLYLINNIFLV